MMRGSYSYEEVGKSVPGKGEGSGKGCDVELEK